jgi:hypothetical protein
MAEMTNAVLENLDALQVRNYVRQARSSDYWCDFSPKRLEELERQSGDNLFIIIHGDENKSEDFFVIPYQVVRPLFDKAALNPKRPRWICSIRGGRLQFRNIEAQADVADYYGSMRLLEEAMGQAIFATNDALALSAENADTIPFDPADAQDARTRIMRSICERRGQQDFRNELLASYGRRCAMTGCEIVDVLEAAHIVPYLGPATNNVTNGLLLRSDLHTLFDCGLVAIDPISRTITLAPSLRDSADYRELHGTRLRDPNPLSASPSKKALEEALKRSPWVTLRESSSC